MDDRLNELALERMTEAFGLDSGLRAATQTALQRMSKAEIYAQLVKLEEIKIEARRLHELAESRQRNVEQQTPRPIWERWKKLVPAITDAVGGLVPIRGFQGADFGIDIGTTNTRIYAKGAGVVLDEPSLVAVQGAGVDCRIVAVGAEARALSGHLSPDMRLIRPMRDGFVSDALLADGMMRNFFDKAKLPATSRPRVVFSVPSAATAAYQRAIQKAVGDFGIGHALLIKEPMAAALGAGILDKAGSSMVVDIGGGTTDMAILSHGKSMMPKMLRLGGDHMTDEIVSKMRRNHNLVIDEATAERIKMELGSAVAPQSGDDPEGPVTGRDLLGRDSVEVSVSRREVAEMLQEPLQGIVQSVKAVLAAAPLEVREDIERNGVVLTGGGAKLRAIEIAMSQELGVPVTVHDDPQLCVAHGMGRALQDRHLYQRLRSSK